MELLISLITETIPHNRGTTPPRQAALEPQPLVSSRALRSNPLPRDLQSPRRSRAQSVSDERKNNVLASEELPWLVLCYLTSALSALKTLRPNMIGNVMKSHYTFQSNSGYVLYMVHGL